MKQYPELNSSKYLSIDIETFDPDLEKGGPGVYRSIPLDFKNPNGYILGVGIEDSHGNKMYLNLGHYDCTQNIRETNLKYLREQFSKISESTLLIGQRLMYDLDWLINWCQLPIKGKIIDVGIAEALLDENQGKYTLDFMGKKYFDEGKNDAEIKEFCAINNLKGDARKWLYKMPHYMVYDYVMQDIGLPVRVWHVQEPLLEKEDLLPLMELECDLTWALLLFRKTGVRISTNVRDKNAAELEQKIYDYKTKLTKNAGFDFNYRSTQHLAFLFDESGIPYPTTVKGNASIPRDYLLKVAKGQATFPDGQPYNDEVGMQLAKDLSELKRADKVLNTFIDGSLVKFVSDNDLIHCSFYNMRTDDYGTRSGRFSSANPNLQQIPSIGVDEYYGRLSRECFIPFDDCWWGKIDYSQIEYRFMAHFARGEGSEEVRAKYNANPRTDYHQYIVDLTGLKRRYAKNLNFGVAYGMGAKHMAEFFQWELDYCYATLNIYHSHAPFIKATIRTVEDVAKRRGYIRTFLKRRSRLLDPNKAYTMFCRLIQGSAADLMKKGMYEIFKAGIFDVLAPHITVHDEIDVSVPKTKEGLDAFCEMKHIMETCVDLKVPIIADMELGSDWADLTEYVDPKETYKLLC